MKLELEKTYKHLYKPSAKKISLVEVPKLNFLMIDGEIEKGFKPGDSPGFQERTAALYSFAYTLKFNSKKDPIKPIDYKVMPLEGLWTITGGEFDITKPDNWAYTLMIMQPDHIDEEAMQTAYQKMLKKKGPSEVLQNVRLESFEEGCSVQTLHIGPYINEPATIEKMKAFAAEQGYVQNGHHHEIYLGDPRRAEAEKLKTILRLPLKKQQ